MNRDLAPAIARAENDARQLAHELLLVAPSGFPLDADPLDPKPLTIATVILAGALAKQLELVYAEQQRRRI